MQCLRFWYLSNPTLFISPNHFAYLGASSDSCSYSYSLVSWIAARPFHITINMCVKVLQKTVGLLLGYADQHKQSEIFPGEPFVPGKKTLFNSPCNRFSCFTGVQSRVSQPQHQWCSRLGWIILFFFFKLKKFLLKSS